jgi:hypothetical protein
MYPTVTVEHLASDTTAIDDSVHADDMKIYQFDREPSNDWSGIYSTFCAPTNVYQAHIEVLAA